MCQSAPHLRPLVLLLCALVALGGCQREQPPRPTGSAAPAAAAPAPAPAAADPLADLGVATTPAAPSEPVSGAGGTTPDAMAGEPAAARDQRTAPAPQPDGATHIAAGAFGDRDGVRQLLFGDRKLREVSIRHHGIGEREVILAVGRREPARLVVLLLTEAAGATPPGHTAYRLQQVELPPPGAAADAELRTLRWDPSRDGQQAIVRLGVRYHRPPADAAGTAPGIAPYEDYERRLRYTAQDDRLATLEASP